MNRDDRARDLLFEIGTEEIPAGFLSWGLEEIRRLGEEELQAARIPHGGILSYGTPRRLTLYVRSLASRQEDLVETVKGPLWAQAFDPNGHPTKAAAGFARSRQIPVEDLQMREVDGVPYAFAVLKQEGQETESLIPEVLQRILKRLVFPKNMYWQDPTVRFARPIRWLVALWGDQIVPVTLGEVHSDRFTRGHRFLGKRNLEIREAKDYLEALFDEFVLADPQKRREKMLSGIASLEKDMGAGADLDPDLVEENLNLVEYPVPFFGSFDPSFLDIPSEVLVTTMKKHQRYFPVRDRSGKLCPFFVGVSNNQATRMQVVREGNERVLRARLSDAAFFWAEDQKAGLSSRVEGLKTVLYQERLGSVHQKSERARTLAIWLVESLGLGEIRSLVDRAAFLAKADLLTNMVYEFPELQGVMGREYARREGEPDRVALALHEQYLPRFAGDRLPTDAVGALVGLADRADTLVAIHHVGLEPTGSQDPYGLRRASRCIDEILWGLELDVPVVDLFAKAGANLGASPETLQAVGDFFQQRQLVQLREKGYGHGMVSLALQCVGHRPLQTLRLLQVLEELKGEAWFASLVTAAVRVRNILAKTPEGGDLDPSTLTCDAERGLLAALTECGPLVREAVARYEWREVAQLLLRLEGPVTRFFDDVLVMDPDEKVRTNRLGLLRRAQDLFDAIGDFSYLKNEVKP
ncbi:glycyl-tRNA synthetase beta chain [Aminomonas paucivorans DSM 12260]|uniref:Glycine--tRNA ligase beta subunit n=1 Tax=Aminomonas paucivorans DSM 12260 TaxID=584708 RepID=E3CYU4_9BACT|nr:glycine--tRNA ligase subunit beta [Aminomonas paucivorans]EFQ23722.1 glycyl-tRNA synthetase beta chain [Aminomonas paucivorans DSM 12260]